MEIMGTNTWEADLPTEPLIKEALKFADAVEADGVATLRGAWIAPDEKMMWCSWDTNNLEALTAAFSEMNLRSGLSSELSVVETFYPT